MSGALWVVGTPIGNLGDLSVRGAEILAKADAIACEDTRRTGRLLVHLGIPGKTLLVANEHAEQRIANNVVARIAEGELIALVTDAGMPSVSDPGQLLVKAVADAGLTVEVAPGPTAAVTALVLSGLVTSRFVFEGFVPRKGKDRASRLAEIVAETRTVVVYESPNRVAATLRELADLCGRNRQAAVARELTKLHEEVLRGTLEELAGHFAETAGRGEFVIVVEGAEPEVRIYDDNEIQAMLKSEQASGVSTRDAVAAVVSATGLAKRRVYQLATK